MRPTLACIPRDEGPGAWLARPVLHLRKGRYGPGERGASFIWPAGMRCLKAPSTAATCRSARPFWRTTSPGRVAADRRDGMPSMEVGSMRHCSRMGRRGVWWRARVAETPTNLSRHHADAAKADGGGKARYRVSRIGVLLLAIVAASPALAQSSLPDHRITPGAVNPVVTPGTVGRTICRRGWTRMVRPSEQTSQEMKRTVMAAYGHAGERLSGYEGDHLVPLALGGAPTDLRNYWPEPLDPPDGWTA